MLHLKKVKLQCFKTPSFKIQRTKLLCSNLIIISSLAVDCLQPAIWPSDKAQEHRYKERDPQSIMFHSRKEIKDSWQKVANGHRKPVLKRAVITTCLKFIAKRISSDFNLSQVQTNNKCSFSQLLISIKGQLHHIIIIK